MSWLEFVVASFRALAWPAIAALAIVVFRSPLDDLIRNLKSLAFMNWKLDFVRGAETKLENILETIPDLPTAEPSSSTILTESSADGLPEDRISGAWYSLRRMIFDLAKNHGKANGSKLRSLANIKWLEDNDIIDKVVADALRSLKTLRDSIRNTQGILSINPTLADLFVEAASHLASNLAAKKS
jgi:hypothetical protein